MLGIIFPEDFLNSKKKTQEVAIPIVSPPYPPHCPVSMELMIKSDKQICFGNCPRRRLGPKGWRLSLLGFHGKLAEAVSSPQCCVYDRRACSSIHGLFTFQHLPLPINALSETTMASEEVESLLRPSELTKDIKSLTLCCYCSYWEEARA